MAKRAKQWSAVGGVPGEWKGPLAGGRLLLLSPFSAKHRRVTADLAKHRNEVVAAIADTVCFIHVSPGGELEALREQVRQRAKPKAMEYVPEDAQH